MQNKTLKQFFIDECLGEQLLLLTLFDCSIYFQKVCQLLNKLPALFVNTGKKYENKFNSIFGQENKECTFPVKFLDILKYHKYLTVENMTNHVTPCTTLLPQATLLDFALSHQ